MSNFRQVGEKMARRIDRAMLGMAGLQTIRQPRVRFLEESQSILPADCMCWNDWALDWSGQLDFLTHSDYMHTLLNLGDVFSNVLPHHPVYEVIADTKRSVMRMSDFQSYGRFKNNPLFREVYRHLDSHFQIAYTAADLRHSRILLTWNRRAFDFDERERQVFHYMGLRLGVISLRIEERQELDHAWKSLCDFVGSRIPAGPVNGLGERDGQLISELMKFRSRDSIAQGMGVRRDSLDKRLGSIREKLGLENHHQLLSALAELRPENAPAGGISIGG